MSPAEWLRYQAAQALERLGISIKRASIEKNDTPD